MDSYQPIYDAVRSQIARTNPAETIERVAREAFDISHARMLLQEQIGIIGREMSRPSAVFRPRIFPDGDQWCALLGDDLMVGVSGFGDTPEAAAYDFDKNWLWQVTPQAQLQANAIREEERREEEEANGQFGVGA